MISFSKNFLFVHVPKTAGNSIQNILIEYSEDNKTTNNPGQDGTERFGITNKRYQLQKHSKLEDYYKQLEPEKYISLYKIMCVRNPWDRLISFYFSPHRKVQQWNEGDFKNLLGKTAGLSDFCQLPKDKNNQLAFNNIDHFIRYEYLENDFSEVCSHIKIPHESLANRNQSSRLHYSHYYTDELIELVASNFADEIDYFNYSFEADPA